MITSISSTFPIMVDCLGCPNPEDLLLVFFKVPDTFTRDIIKRFKIEYRLFSIKGPFVGEIGDFCWLLR